MGPASALKRALVKLLLALAREFAITLSASRDSPDEQVKKAFRKVIVRVHPDKPGGSVEHTKALNDAWSEWQSSQRARGRPSASPSSNVVGRAVLKKPAGRNEYRIRGSAVMLTYQGFPGSAYWPSFVTFVRESVSSWRVKYWSTTLETNKDQSAHAHIMLQFASERDTSVKDFAFRGISPNASTNDLCGEGLCRKRPQQSIDRGMFYVWADKVGRASFV